jgi:hypothetical protein
VGSDSLGEFNQPGVALTHTKHIKNNPFLSKTDVIKAIAKACLFAKSNDI